jgi:magnesium-transporting ATPase (P-type)
MILYFFYKNFVFTLIQYYFAFFCLASGQTIFDDWYITCYNLVFTAFPLCVAAITDSDIDLNDIKMVKKNLALLYRENRDTYIIFSFGQFLLIIGKGIIISFSIYITCCFHEILNTKGFYPSIWYLSLKSYICVIIIVTLYLLIRCCFIVHILVLSIGITTFLLFFIFLILNHYGFLFEFNSKASIFTSLSSPLLYLSAILVISFSFIFDYTFKLIELLVSKSLSSKLLLTKTMMRSKKRRPSLVLDSNPIINLKDLSKKRKSVEISRNFLFNKIPKILEQINSQNQTPKNNELSNQLQSSNKLVNLEK